MYVIPVIIAAVGLWGLSQGEPAPSAFVLAIAILVILATIDFSALTISVDDTGVYWRFGLGWPSGSLRMEEIQTWQITRTNLFEGWGIHWTIWHGWLWNVWGFQAVEITKPGGARVTLGTDDPQGLREAIERFRRGAA
jgi:hypothetical protein